MEKKKYRRDLDLVPRVDGDEREKFWNAYAAIPKDDEHHHRACYARVVTGSGVLSEPDVFALPTPNVPLAPGTLHFQSWYRDPAAMLSGFNLSDGLSILFTP